jgi:hypothetical protein
MLPLPSCARQVERADDASEVSLHQVTDALSGLRRSWSHGDAGLGLAGRVRGSVVDAVNSPSLMPKHLRLESLFDGVQSSAMSGSTPR